MKALMYGVSSFKKSSFETSLPLSLSDLYIYIDENNSHVGMFLRGRWLLFSIWRIGCLDGPMTSEGITDLMVDETFWESTLANNLSLSHTLRQSIWNFPKDHCCHYLATLILTTASGYNLALLSLKVCLFLSLLIYLNHDF